MGRGCAKQATKRIPGIAYELGRLIRVGGNVVHQLDHGRVWSFPVKHAWYEQADLKLIEQSAAKIAVYAHGTPESIYVIPRPGCGNGHLAWHQVRPIMQTLPDNVLVISPETE